MRLSNIRSTQLGDKQPTIKKTVGTLKGAAIHSLEKDRLVFNEYKTIYEERKEEILSSEIGISSFIQQLSNLSISNGEIKSQVLCLGALCLYEGIIKHNNKAVDYFNSATGMIREAIRYKEDPEYYNVLAILLNKVGTYGISGAKDDAEILRSYSIGRNYGTFMSYSFYYEELQQTLEKQKLIYKRERLREEMLYFSKHSLWNLPILIYLLYKYHLYVPPTGWFSFTWTPFYWIGIGLFGFVYIMFINRLWRALCKDDKEWEDELVDHYKKKSEVESII